MTESDQRIEEIVANAAIVRTPRQRVLRVLAVLSRAAGVIGMALALLALVGKANLATCTNDNLGDRNGIQQADNAVTQAFATETKRWTAAVNQLFDTSLSPNARSLAFVIFQTESVTYQRVSARYSRTLRVDQAYRAAHPLGKC